MKENNISTNIKNSTECGQILLRVLKRHMNNSTKNEPSDLQVTERTKVLNIEVNSSRVADIKKFA